MCECDWGGDMQDLALFGGVLRGACLLEGYIFTCMVKSNNNSLFYFFSTLMLLTTI